MLVIIYNLYLEKGLIEDYLNRNADYLEEKIHNQNIGFEQLVKDLKMGSYVESEILRKYKELCDAAHRLGSRNSEALIYEREGVVECTSFILENLSNFKKVLKQHNKKVKGK
jgi:hypothetical protein